MIFFWSCPDRANCLHFPLMKMSFLSGWSNLFVLVVIVSALICTQPHSFAQDPDSLRKRITELENENDKLRRTTELQSGELLELRRKLKDMETVHPDSADQDSSRILLESRTWNYAAGLMLFDVFDSGDAVFKGVGGFNTGGLMTGYAFSAGKDRDRYGITVYQGEYDVKSTSTTPPDISSINKKTNDRIDIDVAWTRMTIRTERLGFGYLWGAKYLRSDKTLEMSQINGSLHDEKRFEGINEWEMLNFGLFLSGRFFPDYPLYGFISGTVSFGIVHGMAVDVPDSTWDDGIIDSTYRTDTHMAWALNGSLGLQHPLSSHSSLRVGYRGHALNSTDGFSPYVNTSTFYDGHQSVFVALDILF